MWTGVRPAERSGGALAPKLRGLLARLRPAKRSGEEASRAPGEYRVLIASSDSARQELQGILSGLPVEFASSIEEGLSALGKQRYSHVVVGYLFAESHMFEFARQVRRLQSGARILCVKGAGRVLRPEVRAGLDAAVRELGCEGFYDLTAWETAASFDIAFDEVLAHFPDALKSMQEKERADEMLGKLRTAVHQLRFLVNGYPTKS